MVKQIPFIAIIILCLMLSASASTVIHGGYYSGTWTVEGSPYHIRGTVNIHEDSTLTIEPGASIYFDPNCGMLVNGILDAVGTETDSIQIRGAECYWFGIRFIHPQERRSHLVYCTISGHPISGAVYCDDTDPIISHCRLILDDSGSGISIQSSSSPTISYCDITAGHGIVTSGNDSRLVTNCNIINCGGAAVSKNNGNLTMIDCLISNNHSSSGSCGGVKADDDTLTLINCTICDNSANNAAGGGLYCIDATAILIDCVISNNVAEEIGGGGIYCENSTLMATNCTISSNMAMDLDDEPGNGGGGIHLRNSTATLSYCTISNNYSELFGAGIVLSDSSNLTVDHCTFDVNWSLSANTGSGIGLAESCTGNITNSIFTMNWYGSAIANRGDLTIGYTDFYYNVPTTVAGQVPRRFGELTQINVNSDSCDVFSNIFLAPQYVGQGDLHLTEGSPCIDAGDPAFAYDPDGTITDIGRYYFDQSTGEKSDNALLRFSESSDAPQSSPLHPDLHHITVNITPNPFNPITTITFDLPVACQVNLQVFDMQGRSVTSHQSPVTSHYAFPFDGSNLSSGIYLYRLSAGEYSGVGKMVLLK